MRSLDTFDRRLLQLVQRDAARTAEALAEQIGLSASAVQRRLKRLADDGFITAQVALVDPARVGDPTFFVVALEVERERGELLGQLRQWLADVEQIQQVYYVTGSADFILVATAPNMKSYEDLMTRLMRDNPNVRRYTTNVVLGISKQGLFIPIDTGAG